MVCICLFHICSTKVPIRISLNYHKHIYFFKEVLYLLNEIYIYIYIYVEGNIAELAPLHTQSVWGLREKMFKLQESEKKGSSCGVMLAHSQVQEIIAI